MALTRLVVRGLLGLVIVLIVAVVGAIGYRVWRQHDNVQALAIHKKVQIRIGSQWYARTSA